MYQNNTWKIAIDYNKKVARNADYVLIFYMQPSICHV
jgi:hypothetical protein